MTMFFGKHVRPFFDPIAAGNACFIRGVSYIRVQGNQKNFIIMRKTLFTWLLLLPLIAAFGQEGLSIEELNQTANRLLAERNYTEALRYIRPAAEQGSAWARYNLGVHYQNNGDHASGVKWFRKAAEQRFPDAQEGLGICYREGKGVKKNLEEAVYWFRAAAEQGFAPAQYDLGVCYHKGEGVERSDVEAIKWLNKAAAQGHQAALGLLRQIAR